MPLIRFGLFVALILLIINSHLLPAALIFFLLLTVELARLWSKFGLLKLETRRKVYPNRLFPGEETVLTVDVHNHKWIPVFFHFYQPLIPELIAPDLQGGEGQQELGLRRYLGWYDKSGHSYRIRAVKRGFFRLPPLIVETWDGLGMFKKEEARDDQSLLIVYPRLCELKDLELTAADLIGDRKDTRPLLYDPIRIAGLRDYTSDIPARFIHWKASAHRDDLLAKVLEPSADIKICVAVDVETFAVPEPDPEAFEEALSVAASLVYWAEGARIPFGLLANGTLKELSCPGVIPISSSTAHINAVLEALARMELNITGTLTDLIKMESSHLPWGATLVLVTKSGDAGKPSAFRKTVYYHIGKGDQH